MTISEARLIRELKKRCTYRRLAEIYYDAKEPGYGNQLYGQDLCKDALSILYPKDNYWMNPPEFNMDYYEGYFMRDTFFDDNASYVGAHWWWE